MKEFFIALMVIFSTVVVVGQSTIYGHVKNDNGEPLIQATVFLVGTYYAAVTDDNGKYSIENIDNGTYTLKASYVGYKSYTTEIELVSDVEMKINLGGSLLVIGGVQINSTRVQQDAAFAFTNIDGKELDKENLGQDVPFLLRWTPSAVVTSDAGTGIGYTGIRIRGSDPTSINVTINGVPLNDAESQNVFWVDLPDFMTSVDNIQIVRGVGTSTNGPSAFGATISMNTNKLYQNPYAHINSTYGSFNTKKLSVNLGTGLLNDRYSIDGRYSIVKSDGYIDRASSDLKSWYFSAARMGKKSSLRLIAFSGKERTYQSWAGTPESKVIGDDVGLKTHYDRNSWFYTQADSVNLFQSDRKYNYYTYENQVDDYQQDHYQLHYSYYPTSKFTVKASAHYTRGFGYFEEFKPNESYDIYDLPEIIGQDGELINSGDLIRRRWLDNDYYGILINSEYKPKPSLLVQFGGAVAQYKGDHYGNVISAERINDINLANLYYESIGDKFDANLFAKGTYEIGKFHVFGDLQIRELNYKINGEDDDLTPLNLDVNYSFFNPKFGVNYDVNDAQNLYASFAVANKEPVRSDIIENLENIPLHETLYDVELGYRMKGDKFNFEWNNYIMLYNNQLVLTGDVNNSGAFIKGNVGKSSRIGAELMLSSELTKHLVWTINTTISSNKVDLYIEDLGEVVNEYSGTDISFSPSIIASNTFMYRFEKGIDVELSTKYVGKQYLDNTSNDNRSLPGYLFSNLRIGYEWDPPYLGVVKFNGIVYNIFNTKYSSNGYTYSYIANEELITENFLYPQAGLHFMLGMNIEF
jgi:iron complex outermembrane receptor protein